MLWRITWSRDKKILDSCEVEAESVMKALDRVAGHPDARRQKRRGAHELNVAAVDSHPVTLTLTDSRRYDMHEGRLTLTDSRRYDMNEGRLHLVTTETPTNVTPLYGQKTHPMKPETRELLRELLGGPKPVQMFNPGVRNRWERGRFIEYVDWPSPYPTHKGKIIAHVKITNLGRAQLRPDNYYQLESSAQWDVDKQLGLLDWQGTRDD